MNTKMMKARSTKTNNAFGMEVEKMDPNQNYYENQGYTPNQNYDANQHYNPCADPNYQGARSVMTKTFLFMVIALSLSTISALLTVNILQTGRVNNFMLLLIGAVVEIISLIVGNVALSKGNALAGGISFIVYSIANGITLSTVFVVYQIGSIVSVFIGCTVMFGVMALIGFVTKKDLTGIGNLCLIVLVGIIVMTVLNLFMGSVALDYLISYVGVALFAGLTAYDTQKIKNMAQSDAVDANIIGLWGALELYLDFINFFLHLLRIFGKSND